MDYVNVEEMLTFSGTGTQLLQVTIIGDNIIEGTETFRLSLSSAEFPQIADDIIVSITEDSNGKDGAEVS